MISEIRFFILILLTCLGLSTARAGDSPLPPEGGSPAQSRKDGGFTSGGAIPAGSSSFLVIDLATGETVAEHNADMPLIPASIMKCITTATLLDALGPDYRFVTRVWIDGPIADGALEGNIIVEGAGDPSLNSRHEPGSADLVAEVTEALVALGLREVKGRVITDDSIWEGPAQNPQWASGDLGQSYGTGCHPFNFQDNASGKSAVKNPTAVFEAQLRRALLNAGIIYRGGDVATGDDRNAAARRILLVNHQSEPLDEIMRSCMMRSDNLFAESLAHTVAVAKGRRGSYANGAEEVTARWKRAGAPMKGVEISDGSGLSRSNRMTARFMAFVLTAMSGNPHYASFFPLAGQEGTLKKFLAETPLDSYVAMKTGSMNGIQCYAGYKLDDDYVPTHVVVVMMNSLGNRGAARAQLERTLMGIFAPGEEE